MGFGNCPACWERICTCGREYESWSTERVHKLLDVLTSELAKRAEKAPPADPLVDYEQIAGEELVDQLNKFASWMAEHGLINANDTDPDNLVREYRTTGEV